MYDVELKNVTKEFTPRRGETTVKAVDNISLQIADGEFFALLGPSGCGKTTTLRMIAGFEDTSSGEILIQGRPVQNVPPFHRPVNTVFQDYALFPHMTVLQNVMFGLEMEGVKKDEATRRANEALQMVQLPMAASRKPRQLSGGQQQRVALARALVKNPTVLLLDEPLGALDLKLRKEMQTELKNMQRELGITFVFVTHDQEEAMTMADRIAVMHLGRVLQVGTPQEVYEEPRTRFVADFIGETNFIIGTLKETSKGIAQIELDDGQVVGAVLDTDLEAGRSVTVAIRPEKISLCPTSGTTKRGNEDIAAETMVKALQDEPNTVILPGRVLQVVYIGTDMRYVIRVGNTDTDLVVRMQNMGRRYDVTFEEGQEVYIYWVDENARVLQD